MFREFLKKDIQAIFEIDQVDFANEASNFGQELGCILIVIDQDGVKNNFRQGENYFFVVGRIEYLQDQTQTNFGFFSQRLALSKFKTKGAFRLLDREGNEALNSDDSLRLLVKKSQKFSYRISIPYNAPIGEIEGLSLNLTVN
jgi:hypothetical protein